MKDSIRLRSGRSIGGQQPCFIVAEVGNNHQGRLDLALTMDMWEKGEYQQIYNKWFGKGTKDALPLNWKMELWP